MNTRTRLAATALVVLSLVTSAQGAATLIERVTAAPGQIVIPYSKYQLPNGLTVIIHEDHSDPLVHIDVTYHVGSAREEVGKSGFAHFFEHMMFQGSDHVADEQHFKILTEAGGTLNGSTNRDLTNYYETVPNNQLEKALWLEADRMGFLLDAVTQQKFENQRDTVKNERGQNYDNVPYGLVSETVSKALFPYGHPYSWMTIGYVEDLNRVSLIDLKNFFLRWYGPNNAAITIGGDVDTARTLALVEKYFGPIKRGPAVGPVRLPAPALSANRHITLVDNYARQPRLTIHFPTVPTFHPDEAPLDCLAEILGQGRTSIFYQQLVRNQRVLSASASNPTSELAGQFNLSITPAPGTSLADTKKLVDEAIAAFEARGVTDDDITRFTGSVEARMINGLQSVSGKVGQLSLFQTFTGNPNRIGEEIRRYTSVTKADVLRVYNQYIKGKPAVIMSVVTRDRSENVVAAQDYTPDPAGYRAPDYGYLGLTYSKAEDVFDRSKIPANGPNPVVKVPPFWREELPNGISAIGVNTTEIPTVSLTLSLPGGHLLEADPLVKRGLPRIVGIMMNEDTKTRTVEQMQDELQKMGSSISVSSGQDDINFSVQTLKKNLDKTLALLEERILQPKFTAAAFDRIKRQQIEGFKTRRAQPASVANELFSRINYGPGNVLGMSSFGTEASVASITLADVEEFYSRYIGSRGGQLVVVGDVTREEILRRLGFLAKLPDRETKLLPIPAAPIVDRTRIYLVDVPRAAQTEIRIGYVTGLKYDATGEYFRAGLANFALGGTFNSRLNLNLREDKGWTYGASSSFSGDKYTGGFSFSSGIRANATDAALAATIEEIRGYVRTGVSADELAFLKSARGQSDARRFETNQQKAGFVRQILDYRLPADFVDSQSRILAAITKPELDRIAAKWLRTETMNIVVVGDKARILPGLESSGYPIVEFDVDGNVIIPSRAP